MKTNWKLNLFIKCHMKNGTFKWFSVDPNVTRLEAQQYLEGLRNASDVRSAEFAFK